MNFSAADKFSCSKNPENITSIALPGDIAQALAAALEVKQGNYQILELPELIVQIVPSKIMDHTGKKVVDTIG